MLTLLTSPVTDSGPEHASDRVSNHVSDRDLISQFLIVGSGSAAGGDLAAGPTVAQAVADWQLPSVKSLVVQSLTPTCVSEMAKSDYVIFVGACGDQSCARTVQLDPIVESTRLPSSYPTCAHSYGPWELLHLTREIYDRVPQAWQLQIPTEHFDVGAPLSSTTQRGCDRATRTIETFLQTYQRPVFASQYTSNLSA
ncbi:MAG: hydrogenase maturation protease [Phormidesmis sp.]